jgi:hypothetical protein
MMPTSYKNHRLGRFVSCVDDAGLLKILSPAASHLFGKKAHPVFPAGFIFTDAFNPAPAGKINLTRGGIFRGKVSQRKNQTNKNRLEERTPSAPN